MDNEKEILKFWKDKDIFNKVREKNKGKEPWSFLDGPITANNPMGVHHAWGRTYKDMFQRYKSMAGFDERFQNGFDCQGLWVEVEVEKELKFKSKKDIEEYGVENFINKCKERVLKYSAIQRDQSIRLGQWMDWDNSYFTMSDENNYAIWHFLKKCKEKGLLYKGKDAVPWCPRCGTSISQHEILTEEYKELTHKSVFFKLPLKDVPGTYFLAWTTTPWTLPGNVALAVNPELNYVKVKDKKGDTYILLREKADLIEQGEIIETLPGKKLQGLEYEGLFDKDYHPVILWEEVTVDEGTGIVHIAPGCGQEDFQLAKELKLPVIDLSDQESRYRDAGELTGRIVNTDTVRDLIFKKLEKKIFKIEDYTHRYPTCWRCKSELIFRVVDEWYISMEKLRKPLIESAKTIKWLPSFGLDREIDWLGNMHDWLISKKRYWGLALPIFECQCGNFEVIGSKEELKEKAIEGWKEFEGKSPHKPQVDQIKIKCSKCGALVSRIPDVGTPWLDAGIVPFSTMQYFSDKKYWEKWFPIDFITESFPGQFKNWFYVLLVMSQVLVDKAPFKTVLGYATVVDEKGEEMHKSKGNAIWFDDGVEQIGADVMRWMYLKQNPFYNMRFGFNIGKENKRKLLTLWNSYTFFEIYKTGKGKESKELLDKWIVSRFNKLVKEVREFLDEFQPSKASNKIEYFFTEDLSLWYIRRSRKRFEKAEQTLLSVLLDLTKLMAPMTPFLAETLYQKIKGKQGLESVHLCDYPVANEKLIDNDLEDKMEKVRQVVNLGLALRQEKGIKVRQPLLSLKTNIPDIEELFDLIGQEVNVKEVIFDDLMQNEVELNTEITEDLRKEGIVREIIRHIQDLRKKGNLTPKDKASAYFSSDDFDLRELFEKNEKEIKETTKSASFKESPERIGEFISQKEIKINDKSVWLGIEK